MASHFVFRKSVSVSLLCFITDVMFLIGWTFPEIFRTVIARILWFLPWWDSPSSCPHACPLSLDRIGLHEFSQISRKITLNCPAFAFGRLSFRPYPGSNRVQVSIPWLSTLAYIRGFFPGIKYSAVIYDRGDYINFVSVVNTVFSSSYSYNIDSKLLLFLHLQFHFHSDWVGFFGCV